MCRACRKRDRPATALLIPAVRRAGNIQHIAPPARLGYATSTYQALAYTGFAVPYLSSLAHAALGWSPTLGFTVVTALNVAATLALLLTTRRPPRRRR